MSPDDGFAFGLLVGLVLGVVIDRAAIPVGERLADLATAARLRRFRRGR